MNNDLISRSALLKDARRLYDCDDEGHVVHLRINAVEVAAIKSAPAVDAEPVRHGKWIPMYEEIETLTTEGWIMRETQTAWKCSECGREEWITRDTMPYCHCGAKMDGDRL